MPDTEDIQLAPAVWRRTTPWRQGSVISSGAAVELGLVTTDKIATAVAVVIAHDCDLANEDLDKEPLVEVIVGRRLETANGNFTTAKNTRVLHLEIDCAWQHSVIELIATQKISVTKEKLAVFEPDNTMAVSGTNLQTLQAWLAARYRRAAFPDELINRLNPIERVFADTVKKSTSEILGIFIDYEPEDDALDEQQPYSLYLTVVYSTDIAGANKIAEAVTRALLTAFEEHFKKDGNWKLIELRGCAALSDTEFTLRDVLQTKQYRLEYLSYRQNPSGLVAEVA